MKTAIIYYSLTGNTKYIAEKIGEKLGADIIPINPVEAYPNKGFKKFFWGGKSAVMCEEPELQTYELDMDKYDRIILGSPVWASNFAPPLRTFIKSNPALKDKKVAAYMCLSGSGDKKAFSKLKDFLGVTELEAELVLIDPMVKVKVENDVKLEEFCEKLHN